MDISKFLLQGLATSQKTPSEGGLRVADYPNPYGLRFGDNAIPKSTGWLGPKRGVKGVMTEYSLGDEKGEYPSMVPGLSSEDISAILREKITPSVEAKAHDFAIQRRASGLSPFNDPFLDELAKLRK